MAYKPGELRMAYKPGELEGYARRAAQMMKAAESRGALSADYITYADKLRAARENSEVLQVGIVMIHKTLIVKIPWERIRDSSEEALTEWLLKYMLARMDDA